MKIALASFLIQLIDAYTYGLYSQEPDCIVTREEIRMEMTVRVYILFQYWIFSTGKLFLILGQCHGLCLIYYCQ